MQNKEYIWCNELSTVPTNKSVYLSSKCGHLKVAREPN